LQLGQPCLRDGLIQITGPLPKSKLGKAPTYELNRWDTLTRNARTGFGHVYIDPTEANIRPTTIGLNNNLFHGHADAGCRSAAISSLVGTCRLPNINPESDFTRRLPALAASRKKSIAGLLPHNYKALNTNTEPPSC
jgi:transposase